MRMTRPKEKDALVSRRGFRHLLRSLDQRSALVRHNSRLEFVDSLQIAVKSGAKGSHIVGGHGKIFNHSIAKTRKHLPRSGKSIHTSLSLAAHRSQSALPY